MKLKTCKEALLPNNELVSFLIRIGVKTLTNASLYKIIWIIFTIAFVGYLLCSLHHNISSYFT
jgi:hypothetical protein